MHTLPLIFDRHTNSQRCTQVSLHEFVCLLLHNVSVFLPKMIENY